MAPLIIIIFQDKTEKVFHRTQFLTPRSRVELKMWIHYKSIHHPPVRVPLIILRQWPFIREGREIIFTYTVNRGYTVGRSLCCLAESKTKNIGTQIDVRLTNMNLTHCSGLYYRCQRERERERIFLIAARILVGTILKLKFIDSELLRMLKMNRLIIFSRLSVS